MRELYKASAERTQTTGPLDEALFTRATEGLRRRYEPVYGGFDGAPKFPPTMALDFALRQWARTGDAGALTMVSHTFQQMARGGIYDQVGGGFSRYSVDAQWLVPHFEKMLYDNALLVRLGAHLWQATRDEEVERVTRQTLGWLSREMMSPEGGFYSSLDADSEGHEGRYYVWDIAELESLLGEDAKLLIGYWGVTAQGNFEGRNILNVPHQPDAFAETYGVTIPELRTAIERAERILYDARERRVRPGRDEKILAGWNGLMVRGIAEAARAFHDEDLAEMAIRSGDFLFRALAQDGRVMRTYKDGVAKIPGFLEDHAALGLAAVALYNLRFESRWLDRAVQLGNEIVARFWEDETQAFFDTASDGEPLVTRPRDATDNAQPSGTSLAVELLLILGDLTGAREHVAKATHALESIAEPMARYPTAFGHALGAADLAVRGAVEVAIVGDVSDAGFEALRRVVADFYLPSLIMAGGEPTDAIALLAGRGGAVPTAYVCRHNTCDRPTSDPVELRSQLLALRGIAS
jgi:uncharacterized protein YyaL (SSP411 family)